jgi:hypothetical protein
VGINNVCMVWCVYIVSPVVEKRVVFADLSMCRCRRIMTPPTSTLRLRVPV